MNICLLNQFYAPDVSPTAQLATSLIEHRAALGDDCTVVCGSGGYADARDSRPLAASVRIRRAWSPSLGRSRIVSRATTYTAYFVSALWTMLRLPKQDVIVVMTTPPFVYLIALAHKLRHSDTRVVLWSMDVYPEVAERLRAVSEHSLLSRVLRRLNAWALPKLDSVIVLDGAMADLLREAGAPPARIHVIPNWERAALYTGADVEPWDGYERLGIADRFIVLYLGNIGLGHQFETVVAAAPRLADDGVSILFVGGGPRWEDLRGRSAGIENLLMHDYVDKDHTPGVLAGAAASLICLDDQALGVMSPSKLHGSLGMATPVVYVGPEGSNVTEAIDQFGCGVSVRTGDVDGLVAAIRAWKSDRSALEQAARQARVAFLDRYCDEATLPLWDDLLDTTPRTDDE